LGNTLLAPDRQRADAARADLCRFIAACYYEPDAAFVEEGLFDSMRQAAACVDPALEATAARLGPAFAAQPVEQLLVDYTRLFLGPVAALARPYASVWLTGENLVMQDDTLGVLRLYEEAGFGIDESFHELPDHVAVEIEFLYLLIFRENEARAASDSSELARITSLRRRFLDEHLGRWLGPFLLAAHDGAQSDFYETLAELCSRWTRSCACWAAAPATWPPTWRRTCCCAWCPPSSSPARWRR
jgi:TorA maturation chaperone TorD